jgi:dehydrogenase/reductase SDR family member 1
VYPNRAERMNAENGLANPYSERRTRPLADKVAIVTGASRGIGKGCALELGSAGATVYITGRTADRQQERDRPGSLEATVEAVARLGGQAIAVACDHANDRDVDALFHRVSTEQGRLDLLVNNAFAVPSGIDLHLPFWESPVDDWDTMIDVGTRSAYVCAHHAVRAMLGVGAGLIVNVSSAGAIRFFHHVVYGIGKAALDRLTRDAARPLAAHNVAVVSIWPYVARTEQVLTLRGFDLAHTESPQFCGRGIVALAGDKGVMRWTGRSVTTRTLADEYGFVDVDGTLPPEQPWQPPG